MNKQLGKIIMPQFRAKAAWTTRTHTRTETNSDEAGNLAMGGKHSLGRAISGPTLPSAARVSPSQYPLAKSRVSEAKFLGVW